MFTRNYRLLAYFVEIVNAGSIHGAARSLFVSAPVVSKALSDLEEVIGETLLQRGLRKLSLTPAGERVYQHALDMSRSAVNAMESARKPEGPLTGHLGITLPTELAYLWLPDVLGSFKRQHPAVIVSVNASDETIDLRGGDIELAVRANYKLDTANDDHYFITLPLVLVCAPDLAARAKGQLTRFLPKLPFIGLARQASHERIAAINNKTNKRIDVPTNSVLFLNNGMVMKQMAVRGYGVALLMEQSVRGELESGVLCTLGENYNFGSVCLRLLFRDQYPSQLAKAFEASVS